VFTNLGDALDGNWGDLRIEGYLGGRQVVVRHYSGQGVDQQFHLRTDDTRLIADGADTTRVVLRVTDEFGNVRPLASDPIRLEIEGPAELIGDSLCVPVGGAAAVWIRATERAGTVRIKAVHPRLGERTAAVEILPAPPEPV
jgi:beta-galactosidase